MRTPSFSPILDNLRLVIDLGLVILLRLDIKSRRTNPIGVTYDKVRYSYRSSSNLSSRPLIEE